MKNLEAMSETAFKMWVQRDLKLLEDTWFFKTQEVGRRGIPDELICMNGRFVAIELKKVGGVLAKIQALTLAKIEEAGGIAIVADPYTWPMQFDILMDLNNKWSKE